MTTTGATLAARRVRLRRSTILIVDDEVANLDLLEALLDSEGYARLVRTTDPRDVPALVAEHTPDLVLLDLHMSHRHGLDVLADLRDATPAGDYRPVLVLTADATGEAKERALALGARDFVTKPFDATEVLLRVENLLDARMLHADERSARWRAEAAEARSALLAAWSRVLAASIAPGTALAQLPLLLVPRWADGVCLSLHGGATHDAESSVEAAGVDVAGAAHTLTARIADGAGDIGALALAYVRDRQAGSTSGSDLTADQPLVDELAARVGLAAEHTRLLASAELAMRERERLLAVVAHDLRNPLGAVAMYAEVLASLQPDEGADAYTTAALGTIRDSAVTMQRLVEDLLDVAALRGGALHVRRVSQPLGVPFEAAERMLRPMAEAAGLTFEVWPVAGANEAIGAVDGARVVQLLSNLVGNAVQFTPPGGTVRVRYTVDGERLTVSVADTGVGIPAQLLPHLFTAFWRGDDRTSDRDARRGAGLGLWIARAIVEAHDGAMHVTSATEPGPRRGTTFEVDLPLVAHVRRRED